MPWQSRDDLPPTLRDATKDLSDDQLAQWLAVANKCLTTGGDEGSCVAQAWGAVRQNAPMLNTEIPASAPDWIMVARVGSWLGHPAGPEIITPAHLSVALGEFDRNYKANGADLAVDYHHQSVMAAMGQVARAPAAGWINQMELRAGGTELWGQVAWTAEAKPRIAAQEYRYLSPVLRFNQPDPVTGAKVLMQVHSVALTNTPFMTSLESLNSSAGTDVGAPGRMSGRSQGQGGPMRILDGCAAALGKTLVEAAALLGVKPDAEDKAAADALVANAAKVTALEAQIAALQAKPAPVVNDAIAGMLNVAAGSDETAVKAAIGKLIINADGAAARVALGLKPDAPVDSMLGAITRLNRNRQSEDAEALVAQAIKDGKVPPAKRAIFVQFAQANPDAAREMVNSLPVQTGATQHDNSVLPAAELTEGEAAVSRQLGVTKEAMIAARK